MTSANKEPNPEISTNKSPEKPSTDESKKNSVEEANQNESEVELDPHPSKALGELLTGTDESSS